ncbi:acetamidase/formamidase family protein [Frateuria sp. Soil773]|uniref:acetamidase/formamidase family protein n=1 Tax=Frateuria sp. Soil773 TaxID=1736407 RepID=UPI000AF49DBE|nr:acetamidase/formamidase family protein [Frateuria sp. Soil773]
MNHARLCCCLLWLGLSFPAWGAAPVHESWRVRMDLWGNASYQALELERQGETLGGTFGGDPLTGTWRGAAIRFSSTDARGATCVLDGTVRGAGMTGSADCPDPNRAGRRVRYPFTASRLPGRPAGGPRIVDFTPTRYANVFSADLEPVLTLWPGDTVRTRTVDSGGVDEHGVTRALFGNPQVGPFYIATARPGDTLAVHIRRLRPNRDYADSLDSLVGRATATSLAGDAAKLGKPVRWTLDRAHGRAFPAEAGGALAGFSVPLRPMLGGMAVAPGFGAPPLSTGDTGPGGGNMDFNQLVEGNTVYLPVQQPGALLYFGDAHALQGDGETSQYALETSMEWSCRWT